MAAEVEEMNASDAWSVLQSEDAATLIDVRSRAEWTFVGIPDLSSLGGEAVLIEWQSYPTMEVNDDFADSLLERLKAEGRADGPVLFICRSGARSRAAAHAIADAVGPAVRLINVSDGFEGPHDADGHRGTVMGWKAAGLPWRQG